MHADNGNCDGHFLPDSAATAKSMEEHRANAAHAFSSRLVDEIGNILIPERARPFVAGGSDDDIARQELLSKSVDEFRGVVSHALPNRSSMRSTLVTWSGY